jgi:hypothetical protein
LPDFVNDPLGLGMAGFLVASGPLVPEVCTKICQQTHVDYK